MNDFETKQKEFFRYVWDHTVDPFVVGFDIRRALNETEREWLQKAYLVCQANVESASQGLKSLLERNGAFCTALLLQISGLTRNRIISDLKASVGTDVAPKSYETLYKSEAGVRYLVRRLQKVFEPLYQSGIERNSELLWGVFESLNQATYPGYIRQERAKRQGHVAEQRLADLMHGLGVPFEPAAKLEQAIVQDIRLWGVSFDLIVPNQNNPLVLIQSMVQSANIGMFGQSKADEVKKAATAIRQNCPSAPPPYLVALVDGVGFNQNREGLKTVLTTADEFVQFATLWKFVVVVAHALGKVALLERRPELENFTDFLARHQQACEIRDTLPNGLEAGFTKVALKEAALVPQEGTE